MTLVMSDFKKIIGEEKPTLVDFFATWCGPCKAMHPIIEDVKKAVGDTANIVKVDIDQNREAAVAYRVLSVPTLIIFRNGEPVWRTAGVQPAQLLIDKLNELAR